MSVRPKPGKSRWTRCGMTGKVIFKSHEQAAERGGYIITQPGARMNSFRTYRCTYCSFWHITSND